MSIYQAVEVQLLLLLVLLALLVLVVLLLFQNLPSVYK